MESLFLSRFPLDDVNVVIGEKVTQLADSHDAGSENTNW